MSLTDALIQSSLEKAGLAGFFPSGSIHSLTQFSLKMLQINETLNLTKWSKAEDFIPFHLLDSAYVLPEIRPLVKESDRWMDLGSGCGFPGVILIAAFPGMEVTLMDSVAKKTKALEECLLAAQWKAKTWTGRAEDLGQNPEARESWDGLTARAVADFRVVLEYGIPLLKVGGYLVNWMTEEQLETVDKSQQTLQKLHCKILRKAPYTLPGLTQSRYFVLVEKMGKTPMSYPRPVGQPQKHPL